MGEEGGDTGSAGGGTVGGGGDSASEAKVSGKLEMDRDESREQFDQFDQFDHPGDQGYARQRDHYKRSAVKYRQMHTYLGDAKSLFVKLFQKNIVK